MGDWIHLRDLRPGALFETRDGIRAIKSEYHYDNGAPECILLDSGEYAHFPNRGLELVREFVLAAALADERRAALEDAARVCEESPLEYGVNLAPAIRALIPPNSGHSYRSTSRV